MTTTAPSKLSVLCRPDGEVQRVVTNEAGALLTPRLGAPLSMLLQPDCLASFQRFLRAVHTRSAAFDWELNLATRQGPALMHFAGLRLRPDALLVVGSSSLSMMVWLLESFLSPARARQPQSALEDAAQSGALDRLSEVNSELVNLQRELAKKNAALRDVTRQRNELLAMAAHDLRTPFSVVKGYCQLLLSQLGGDLTAQKRTMVQRVSEATEYAIELLAQTLEHTRREADGLPLLRADTDLIALIAATIDLHRGLARDKDIQLVLLEPPALPKLSLDRIKIQQVIGNLLTNAIKYSHRGSRVDVAVARTGEHVLVSIADHGLGIAATDLPRVFRPFQTTATRPTEGEHSTGLGLAIARQLVEAHGGTISVVSELSRGTTFHVQLPLRTSAVAAPSAGPTALENSSPVPTRRIAP